MRRGSKQLQLGERTRCVYCDNPSGTRDHVPPRCLLERPLPTTLITVPSCRTCNASFAKDEEYFATVLAHVGSDPKLERRVEPGGLSDRALTRRPFFAEMIENSLRVDSHGRVFLMPDEDRLTRIATKVAFGLFADRYRRVIPRIESFRAKLLQNLSDPDPSPPYEILLKVHNERFISKRWEVVQAGVFSYIFVRIGSNPSVLHCLLNFYGTLWADVECPWPAGTRGLSPWLENVNQLLLPGVC